MVLRDGELFLAPGDMPGTVFATEAEAECAIDATVIKASGSFADTANYTLTDPRTARRKRA